MTPSEELAVIAVDMIASGDVEDLLVETPFAIAVGKAIGRELDRRPIRHWRAGRIRAGAYRYFWKWNYAKECKEWEVFVVADARNVSDLIHKSPNILHDNRKPRKRYHGNPG